MRFSFNIGIHPDKKYDLDYDFVKDGKYVVSINPHKSNSYNQLFDASSLNNKIILILEFIYYVYNERHNRIFNLSSCNLDAEFNLYVVQAGIPLNKAMNLFKNNNVLSRNYSYLDKCEEFLLFVNRKLIELFNLELDIPEDIFSFLPCRNQISNQGFIRWHNLKDIIACAHYCGLNLEEVFSILLFNKNISFYDSNTELKNMSINNFDYITFNNITNFRKDSAKFAYKLPYGMSVENHEFINKCCFDDDVYNNALKLAKEHFLYNENDSPELRESLFYVFYKLYGRKNK